MAYYDRKLPRLQGFDYSQPYYYYVTICTDGHRCLFGGPGELNLLGQIARDELKNVPSHYENVMVDQFVIMPNHVHVIFIIGQPGRATLSTVVGLYKSTVSKRIHEIYPELNVWQKSFYDEIIRNEKHYLAVWNYIDGNPSKWEEDKYYAP